MIGVKVDFRHSVPDSKQLIAAVHAAKRVFESAAQLGIKLNVIDLGSGLPAQSSAYATELLSTLDGAFPEASVRVLADPVAFFDQHTTTMVVNILAKSGGAAAAAIAAATESEIAETEV